MPWGRTPTATIFIQRQSLLIIDPFCNRNTKTPPHYTHTHYHITQTAGKRCVLSCCSPEDQLPGNQEGYAQALVSPVLGCVCALWVN